MAKVYLNAPRFPHFKIANSNRKTFVLAKSRARFPYYRGLLVLVTMTMVFHAYSLVVSAQSKIIAIEKNLRPLNTLTEAGIKLIRGATVRSEPVGMVPISLEIGDRLVCSSKDVTVKVSCNNSTELVLSGRFIITFLPARRGGGCSIFDDGKGDSTVNVKAGDATEIQTGKSGEIRLGSKRTRYEVRSPARLDEPADIFPDVLVFEGEVDVASRVFSGVVNEGKKLKTEGDSRPKIKDLGSKDFLDSAKALARIDVSEADDVKDRDAAFRMLVNLHEEVLKEAKNPAKLMALKKAQVDLGIPDIVLTLKSRAKGFANIPFTNNCTQPIMIRFATENLPFARFLTAAETQVAAGGKIQTRLEFNPSGLALGKYLGRVEVNCLNCSGVKCRMARQQWLVRVNVQ